MNSNRIPAIERPSDQEVQDRRHPSPDDDAVAAVRGQQTVRARKRLAIASKEDAQQILELRMALAEHRLRRPPEQPTPLSRSD